MKLFNKIAVAFISGAMALGAGIAIVSSGKSASQQAVVKAAEGDVAYTLNTPKSGSNTAYASYYNVTVNGLSWNVPGNQNFDGYWRLGGKNFSNVDRTIKSNASIDKNIKEVQVTTSGVSNNNLKYNSLTLTVASDKNFANIIDTVKITSPAASGTTKINPSSSLTNWPEDSYYKFDFNLSNSKNNNYGLNFNQIDFIEGAAPSVTYATGINVAITEGDFTIDENDTVTMYQNSHGGMAYIGIAVSVTPNDASNKEYTWETNDGDKLDADENGIIVDTTAVGTYWFKVTALGSETEGSVTKTIYFDVIEDDRPTLTSITVEGTPLYDTQEAGSTFNTMGLSFLGHYSDGSSDYIDSANITWDALVEGEYVTGSYNGIAITVTSVTVVGATYTDIAGIAGKVEYICATENGVTYYLQQKGTGSAPAAVTSKADATAFNVTLVDNNTYQFENDGKYLYSTATNNGVRFGSSTNINWVVTGPTGNLPGSYTLQNTGTSRFLTMYNHQDFRNYTTAGSNRTVNTDFEESVAVTGLTIVASANAQTRFLKGSTFDAASAGYTALLNYSNGNTDDVTSSATWTLDTSTITNSAVITAEYSNFTATVSHIEIYEVVATKLSFDTTNMKLGYLVGESLDVTGLVVSGLDDSNNVVIAQCDLNSCTFTPTTLSTAGTQVITVVFTNPNGSTATGTFNVTVTAFSGYSKITSLDDITVGDSYIFGVENNSKSTCLMGGVTGTNKYIDSVTSSAVTSSLDAINTADLENTVHPFTLVKTENNGLAMVDLTTNKFIEGNTSNYAYLKDAYNANCEWHFSFEDGHLNIQWKDTTRVFGYNVSSPRFTTYAGYANYNYNMTSGTAHLVLFKLAGSSVKTNVESFNTNSLLMNSYVGDNTYNASRCTANYGGMKSAFVALSEAERMLFLDGTTFAEAYARFNSWCVANGEEYSSTLNEFASRQSSRFTTHIDNGTTAIVMICCLLGVSTAGAYFVIRKKKEN